MTTPEQFQSYLEAVEGARFEFKQARGGFPFDDLILYCYGVIIRLRTTKTAARE